MSRDQRPIDRIAPDDFTESYPGDTIDECLNYAHRQAETVTPESELPKCPVCRTRRVYSKTSRDTGGETVDSDYRCANRHHFDEPVYLDRAEETDDFDLADLDGFEGAGGGEDDGPFEWVDPDDLAEPPLRRLLPDLADETKTALAIFWYRPWNHTDADPSYSDLGEVLGYSRQWVGERVRAWQRGEYRDIVRDPRPRVTIATDAEEVSAE
jgi:hypothetical protein